MTDIIDFLIDHEVSALRNTRAQAKTNAQASFEALLETETSLTLAERYAVAYAVTSWHQLPYAASFYKDLLDDELPSPLPSSLIEAGFAASPGPWGTFREPELEHRNEPGPWLIGDGSRIEAALEYAHLLVFHPRDSSPVAIQRLLDAGFNEDEIVSLGQLISFLAFQSRVVHGIRVLGGVSQTLESKGQRAQPTDAPTAQLDGVLTYPDLVRPTRFVNHPLGWQPWVKPVEKHDLSDEQMDALIQPERANMPYFRLLARDPQALKARTLTDLDIFYGQDGDGVGLAERELAATVTSVFNGCVFCASVHAGRAEQESGRSKDVNRLIDEGTEADLGNEVWNAIRDAALALTTTPPTFDSSHVSALRKVGLNDTSIVDIINATSFFNWANRLMLSLGEPEIPKRYQ